MKSLKHAKLVNENGIDRLLKAIPKLIHGMTFSYTMYAYPSVSLASR